MADALAAGRPFVLVFATPLFCSSRTCGPTLDNVKGIAAPYKDRIDFIHVEPYKLEQVSGGLQLYVDASGGFQVVPALTVFQTPPEPTATYQVLGSPGWSATAKYGACSMGAMHGFG